MKFRYCSVVLDYTTTCSLTRKQTKCKLFFQQQLSSFDLIYQSKANLFRLTFHNDGFSIHSVSVFLQKTTCMKSQSFFWLYIVYSVVDVFRS